MIQTNIEDILSNNKIVKRALYLTDDEWRLLVYKLSEELIARKYVTNREQTTALLDKLGDLTKVEPEPLKRVVEL